MTIVLLLVKGFKVILLIGAGGKTGLEIIRAAAEMGLRVKALVRSQLSADKAIAVGAAGVVIGDMTDPEIWSEALAGISRVYLICPNMHPQEFAIANGLIDAAQTTDVELIVYHSVLHPQTEAMPHHWQKLRVEELLFGSQIPYTILQPTAYMQNLLAGRERIIQEGILANPYPTTTQISLVDLADVAAVAAKVLKEPGHAGAIYELVGTAALSQNELAQLLGEVLNRPVIAEEIPLTQWQDSVTARLPPYAVDTLNRMFRYYAANGLVGNSNVLHYLLGRPPRTLQQFAKREFK